MCTAATFYSNHHYFGRNLDLEISFDEAVFITPRNFVFNFRNGTQIANHYAIIGMATSAVDSYPLYYDATNEKGLSMAGLNFPGNAFYNEISKDHTNLASFELLQWLLCRCATVEEARKELAEINVTNEKFSSQFETSLLHWIVSDKKESITVESTESGLHVYDNPIRVLTNNPTFDYHMTHVTDYMQSSREPAQNNFGDVEFPQYSRGMGGFGIPGDLSSASRFVKAAFTKLNILPSVKPYGDVTQFFHILGSVEQQRGCVHLKDDDYEYTIYSSCCDMDDCTYYYKTYENSQITAISLYNVDVDAEKLVIYPLINEQQIASQN